MENVVLTECHSDIAFEKRSTQDSQKCLDQRDFPCIFDGSMALCVQVQRADRTIGERF